jgi:hypothetical protein
LRRSEQVPILLDFYSVSLFSRCHFREGRLVAEKALAMAERLDDQRSKPHARVCVIILSIFADPMSLDDSSVSPNGPSQKPNPAAMYTSSDE